MTAAAWCLGLVSVLGAASGDAGWRPVPDRAGVDVLLGGEEQRLFYAVALVPTGTGIRGAPRASILDAVQRALRDHPRVDSSFRWNAALPAADDADLARALGRGMDVDRVVLVRPRAPDLADPRPRLDLELWSDDGRLLRALSSAAFFESSPGNVLASPAPEVVDSTAAFRERALTLRTTRLPRGGKRYVLQRDGRDLTADERKELEAPPEVDATVRREAPSSTLQRRFLYGSLIPAGCALSPFCVLLPVGACLLGCAGAGVVLPMGGNPNDACSNALLGAVVGAFYCAPVVAGGGALVGLLTAVASAAVGTALLVRDFIVNGTTKHPYAAFVAQHNSALAEELGVDPDDVEDRYFPGEGGK